MEVEAEVSRVGILVPAEKEAFKGKAARVEETLTKGKGAYEKALRAMEEPQPGRADMDS